MKQIDLPLYKFYLIEGMTQEDLNELALERNNLSEEVYRLNNIINKLEAHCDIELNRLAMGNSHTYEDSLGKTRFVNEDIYNEISKIKYILQELKGGKDNE